MLFVPSFWWHEVTSSPGLKQNTKNDAAAAGDYIHLNVAINHWFDPLYLKEYPCATCRKYPNKNYGNFLLNNSKSSYSEHQKKP
mmetsp:Transcript_4310/g.7338  ORF Transcript_4310/g.7338 Transcript_4310/m.7338 type:complete len:84 (+) Transcript_4310:1749-2000(+)